MKLSEFERMWGIYPSEHSVMEDAFGEKNSPNTSKATRDWANKNFNNTCCVRLCFCLNHTENHKISLDDTRKTGLNTITDCITGKNGKYIFNVPNMSTYMNDIYGKPDKLWKWTSSIKKEIFEKEIKNRKGIIIFHKVGGGLNGHVDLWKNGVVKTYNLFDSADKIEFWESK